MKVLKHEIKVLQAQGLLKVSFFNNSNTISLSSRACDYSVDCASFNNPVIVEIPELKIYDDDTEESVQERLEALEAKIEAYEAFVEHRSKSPNFAESLKYSLLLDKLETQSA